MNPIQEIFQAVLGAACVAFTAEGLGHCICRHSVAGDIKGMRLLCGLALLSCGVFIAGVLGFFYREYLYGGMYLAAMVAAPGAYIRWRAYGSKIKSAYRELTFFGKWAGLVLCACIGFIAVSAVTPPAARDELGYHVYLPMQWLIHQAIFVIPSDFHTYFPKLCETLYMLAMLAGNDMSARLVHVLFFGLSLAAIYQILSRAFNAMQRDYKLFACMVFASTPIVVRAASWAYVDMALTACVLFSVLGIIRVITGAGPITLIWAGACAGWGAGTKYHGLVWAGLLCFCVAEAAAVRKIHCVRALAYFVAGVLMGALPWYIHTWVVSGNPFFPFAQGVFHSPLLRPGQSALLESYFHTFTAGTSFFDFCVLPFKLALYARFEHPQAFDGVIGSVYLFLFVFMAMRYRRFEFPLRSGVYMVIMFVLVWFLTSQQIRFLLPVLALGIVCAARMLEKECSAFLNSVSIVLVCFSFMSLVPVYGNEQPWRYVCGQEGRGRYLARVLPAYSAVNAVNQHVPRAARVMLFMMEPMQYYVRPKIYYEPIVSDVLFCRALLAGETQASNFLRQRGVTYIITNDAAVYKGFGEQVFVAWKRFCRSRLSQRFSHGAYMVHRIRPH